MNIRLQKLQLFSTQHFHMLIFVLLSISGLIIGMVLSVYNRHQISKSDVMVFFVMPTHFSLLAVNMTPIIITVFLVGSPLSWLCYPFVWLHSVCRGFLGMFFYITFKSGAWVIRSFLLFSDSVTAILTWWLLLRNFRQHHTGIRMDAFLSLIITCIVTAIDFQIVAPFFSDILVH